jgi:hypothetical protein
MAHVPMTRADAAELWDLLCRINGPRLNPFPDRWTDEQWREQGVDAWWAMAQRCDWDRSEVFPAVEALAQWAKEDGWRWPAEDNTTDPKPVMPAHINELIELRRSIRNQAPSS